MDFVDLFKICISAINLWNEWNYHMLDGRLRSFRFMLERMLSKQHAVISIFILWRIISPFVLQSRIESTLDVTLNIADIFKKEPAMSVHLWSIRICLWNNLLLKQKKRYNFQFCFINWNVGWELEKRTTTSQLVSQQVPSSTRRIKSNLSFVSRWSRFRLRVFLNLFM